MKAKRLLADAPLMLTLLLPGLAHAGAWTQQKGHFYTKASLNAYYSDKYYNNDWEITSAFDFAGGLIENPDYYKSYKDFYFLDVNATLYFEYGLFDWLSLITSIPYKYHRYDGDDMVAETVGIGDIDVAAKFRIFEKPFVFSAQVLGKLPWAYDEADFATLGNGQADIELRLLAG